MDELPWMKHDFDIGKVLAADDTHSYRMRLENALDDTQERLQLQRVQVRQPGTGEQIDRLMDAIALARLVITAAHDASHGR